MKFNKVKIDLKNTQEIVQNSIKKHLPNFHHFGEIIKREGVTYEMQICDQQNVVIGDIKLDSGSYYIIFLTEE